MIFRQDELLIKSILVFNTPYNLSSNADLKLLPVFVMCAVISGESGRRYGSLRYIHPLRL